MEGCAAATSLDVTWEQLLDRVGTPDQVASATPVTLTVGSAAGARALDVRTIERLTLAPGEIHPLTVGVGEAAREMAAP